MARPLAIVDTKVVELLAKHHCSPKEIAEVVGCSIRTLHRRFGHELCRGRLLACLNLRELQWRSAMRGNVRMLIFLGKNMLGQTERGLCARCNSNGRAEDYVIHDNDEIVIDLRHKPYDASDNDADDEAPTTQSEPLPTKPETERKPAQIVPFVTSELEEFGPMVANFR